MKHLLKSVVLIAVLSSLFLSTKSQASNISDGQSKEKDSSYYTRLFDGLANVTDCSPNGEYAVFFTGEGGGLLWQRSTNTYTTISHNEDAESNDVTNDGTVIGRFINPEVLDKTSNKPTMVPAYWTKIDSSWHYLELPSNYLAPDRTSGGSANGVSADGKRIVGYIYTSDDPEKFVPCSWYEGKFEKVYNLPWSESMGGSFTCISGDGNLIGGFADKTIFGVSLADRSPILYSLETNEYIKLSDVSKSFGDISDINADGTRAVGREAVPILWSKGADALKNICTSIPYVDFGYGNSVSDNGVTAGVYSTSDNPDTRAFIYFENVDRAFNLGDYAEKVYNVNMGYIPLMQATAISSDGTIIFTNDMAGNPGMLVLKGSKKITPPENIKVFLQNDSAVLVQWDLPFDCGSVLTGFDIFRDSIKLSTVDSDALSFTDQKVPLGNHIYSVSALYEIGSSSQVYSKFIEINEGLYSPKDINVDILYNKVVTVSWPMPSPYFIETTLSDSKSGDRIHTTPDTIKFAQFSNILNLSSPMESSVAIVDDYIYTVSWNSSLIYVYTKQGALLKTFKPECPYIQDLAYDGINLHVVVANDTVYKLDKTTGKALGKAQIPGNKRLSHISYLASLNDNQGGFECGTGSSGFYMNKDYQILDSIFTYQACLGTALYDSVIFVSEVLGKQYRAAKLNLYNAKTGEFMETLLDFSTRKELEKVSSFSAGGMSIGTNDMGATCLFYVLQSAPFNFLYIFELDQMPKLLGYNIYRNGSKLNTEPYPYRNYQEIITTPGTFTYSVEALFEHGSSQKTKEVSATIKDRGTCSAVIDLNAESMFNHVNLSWKAIEDGSLVGYTIFRDGEQLNQEFIAPVATRFSDAVTTTEKTYNYELLAFYNSSCEAIAKVDIAVSSTGKPMPVSFLSGSISNEPKASLTWSNPFVDSPLALRYGNGTAVDAIGLNAEGHFLAVVGWGPDELTLYNDYKVVGVEVYIHDKPLSMDLIVMENEKVVVEEAVEVSTLRARSFNYISLKTPRNLKSQYEFVVGFRVKNEANKQVIGTDNGPAKLYYSDLICIDSSLFNINDNTNWLSSGGGNWIIAAALTKNRAIGTESKNPFTQTDFTETKTGLIYSAKEANLSAVSSLSKAPSVAQSKAVSPLLLGYKIRKDDAVITPELITSNSFEDPNVSLANSYFYEVLSIWKTGEEIPSEITLDATSTNDKDIRENNIYTYPNPATSKLNISTSEVILKSELINAQGNIVWKGTNVNPIDVSALNSGIYFLRISTNNGVFTKKVQIIH